MKYPVQQQNRGRRETGMDVINAVGPLPELDMDYNTETKIG